MVLLLLAVDEPGRACVVGGVVSVHPASNRSAAGSNNTYKVADTWGRHGHSPRRSDTERPCRLCLKLTRVGMVEPVSRDTFGDAVDTRKASDRSRDPHLHGLIARRLRLATVM